MSTGTTRPTRVKRQPIHNQDKVELNLELIQKLESNKATRAAGNVGNSNAKLLVSFINAINESWRFNREEVKEKQLQNKKYMDEDQKNPESYSHVPTKRSKLNDGRVVQYYQQANKTNEKISQKGIEQKTISQTPKTRQATTYLAKKEQQKNTVKEKSQKSDITSRQNNSAGSTIKPFKRYSYHVAIAYRIHLEKIKLQMVSNRNPELLDPTYPARKLKQRQVRLPQSN